MSQYLKDQLPTFLVGALVVVVLYFVFQKREDPGAVIKYQIDQLKAEMKQQLQREHDSLVNLVTKPIEEDKTDSLTQVAIDLNKRTLYELKKKNAARIDTVGSDELQRTYAGYGGR